MHRAWTALFVTGLLACGGATPALEGGTYHEGDISFRLGDPPPAWRAIRVDKATLAWRDEANRASILIDARCHQKDEDVPLVALTEHLLMGTTERAITSQDTIPFDAREALHTRLRAKLDGVPMDYDVFVAKKNDCVYDFVYVGEPGGSEGGVPGFERFVSTFHAAGGAP